MHIFFDVDSCELVGWSYEGSGTATHKPIMKTQLLIHPQQLIYPWIPDATTKTPTPNQYNWYYGPVKTTKPLIQQKNSVLICELSFF